MGNKKAFTSKGLPITVTWRWSRRKVSHHWAVEDAGLVTVFSSAFHLSPTCFFFYQQVNFSRHRGFSLTLLQLQSQSIHFAHAGEQMQQHPCWCMGEKGKSSFFLPLDKCLLVSSDSPEHNRVSASWVRKRGGIVSFCWRPCAKQIAVSCKGSFVSIGVLTYHPSQLNASFTNTAGIMLSDDHFLPMSSTDADPNSKQSQND